MALDVETAGYEAARLLGGLMSGKLKGKHVVPVEPLFVAKRRSTEVVAGDDPTVASALRFIRDFASKPIGVEDVVEMANASMRTLERRFQRTVGRSILAEINLRRIGRAKHLLVETRLPCRQVSTEAGFASVKTFNRVFQRTERIAPRAFRRSSN